MESWAWLVVGAFWLVGGSVSCYIASTHPEKTRQRLEGTIQRFPDFLLPRISQAQRVELYMRVGLYVSVGMALAGLVVSVATVVAMVLG